MGLVITIIGGTGSLAPARAGELAGKSGASGGAIPLCAFVAVSSASALLGRLRECVVVRPMEARTLVGLVFAGTDEISKDGRRREDEEEKAGRTQRRGREKEKHSRRAEQTIPPENVAPGV